MTHSVSQTHYGDIEASSLFTLMLHCLLQPDFCNVKGLCGEQIRMTSGNEDANDVNSPVQTQESEMGDAELQVDGNNRVGAGEKSDESRTNVAVSL